ncbi:Fic family protein [uncultured Adlercreutzia sp.]|uniref:Fic family protein n=1 Tax=uncultured Adlercreutzia sp. TaxID=875803 RepID=UPI0026F408CE|nr:Fic family protein [uncultured Adlercreutzia sp.]
MTAEKLDIFDYEPAREHSSEAARRHYWAVAIGLQQVDGLEVSPYLRKVTGEYVAGKRDLAVTGELVRAYHGVGPGAQGGTSGGEDRAVASREADLVAQRIAELLASAPFALAPEMLQEIHRYLFQDLDPTIYQPGRFKTERMVKQEDILNGDSVLYADPLAYDMALRGAFAAEQAKSYRALEGDELAEFCHFIAFIWQVHPFAEGNTRTVAVLSELYLNQLGFTIANEPFEKHARYYRDALVRAMYRNADAGIFPEESFLVAFYENVLGRAENNLDRKRLICTALFETPAFIRNVDPAEALDKRNLA